MNATGFWICIRGRLKMQCETCEDGRLTPLVRSMQVHFKRVIIRVYYDRQNFLISGTVCEIPGDLANTGTRT